MSIKERILYTIRQPSKLWMLIGVLWIGSIYVFIYYRLLQWKTIANENIKYDLSGIIVSKSDNEHDSYVLKVNIRNKIFKKIDFSRKSIEYAAISIGDSIHKFSNSKDVALFSKIGDKYYYCCNISMWY